MASAADLIVLIIVLIILVIIPDIIVIILILIIVLVLLIGFPSVPAHCVGNQLAPESCPAERKAPLSGRQTTV